MSNRKVEPLKGELQDEERESVELIKMGLDILEDGIEVDTPSLEWFEQMVIAQHEIAKRKLFKEVISFLIVALIIVSLVLFTMYKLPAFYFILQGMATLFIIFYSVKHYRKQVDGV